MVNKEADEARFMLVMREPLEILDHEHWWPLEDERIAATIYALPITRASDVRHGIRLPDGRVVRFAEGRHHHFESIQVQRNYAGKVDGATGYCTACGAYRVLRCEDGKRGTDLVCTQCQATDRDAIVAGIPV